MYPVQGKSSAIRILCEGICIQRVGLQIPVGSGVGVGLAPATSEGVRVDKSTDFSMASRLFI